MSDKGYAKKLRAMLQELSCQGDITYTDIIVRLDLITDKEKQPVYHTMRDFIRRGECVRVRRGVVRYVKNYQPKPANKTGCMFRYIRANRRGTITVADLVANCGVSDRTAKEYLNILTHRGFVRRISDPGMRSKYQMIHDPGPNLVRNDENRDKLQKIRADQRLAAQKIDEAMERLAEVKRILTTEDPS